MKRLRRYLILAACTLAALAATSPSSAADPQGGCATQAGFFLHPVEGSPFLVAALTDQLGNNDGFVCVLDTPNPPHPGHNFLVIDNRIQAAT